MISLDQLTLAWRKAKVDLYYSTNPPLFVIADYEADLIANLQGLQARLNGADEAWIEDTGFLGTWTLAPKAIKPWTGKQPKDQPTSSKQDTTLIFADPAKDFKSVRDWFNQHMAHARKVLTKGGKHEPWT